MGQTQDQINCIKNLLLLMGCDGKIASREKEFLREAARQMDVQVEDWNGLFKEVLRTPEKIYPIAGRKQAEAALQAMIVMARADGRVDEKEKECLKRFAKSICLSNEEWKRLLEGIDMQSLFEPFAAPAGSILAIRDDFELIDQFLQIASECSVPVQTGGYDELIRNKLSSADVVCFHAAADRNITVQRCRKLLEISGKKTAAILQRHQGYQVRYMLEIGLPKCVIEPVYARDVEQILQLK